MMTIPRRCCVVGALLALQAVVILPSRAEERPRIEVRPDVVYGHKMGMALTYDVLQPAENPNGAALLFMVSGGWVSRWFPIDPFVENLHNGNGGPFTVMADLLKNGYTLFLVRHGSAPLFKVPDAVADVRRAVRHVKSQAASYHIDPERIGVFGASAGGHLSLMLGTTGDDGDPSAEDGVDRFGNRVSAVVAYFPPVDLEPYHNDVRFPATHFDKEKVASVSPLFFVTADDAPALLLHGEKDTLVPPDHSRRMHEAFEKGGVESRLKIFGEAGHSFLGEDNETASTELIHWFDRHLTLSGLLEGDWRSVAQMGEGNEPLETRLTFRRKAGDSSETSNGWEGSAKMEGDEIHFNVEIDGSKVILRLTNDDDGEERTYAVEASLEGGDRLAGHWSISGDATDSVRRGWEAVKVE